MKYLLAPIALCIFTIGLAQPVPVRFDGIVEENEWTEAQTFAIDFEIDPGDNSPAPYPTKVFVRYTATHL